MYLFVKYPLFFFVSLYFPTAFEWLLQFKSDTNEESVGEIE